MRGSARAGGWMIHCQRRHHTNITYRASSEHLESIYNVLCRDWGHVFTRHNVYIIQTRIFTPELSSLLEFTKAIRSQWDFISSAVTQGDDIMTEDRGCGVTLVTGPGILTPITGPSCLTGDDAQGVSPSHPPICGPCARWLVMSHCFPSPPFTSHPWDHGNTQISTQLLSRAELGTNTASHLYLSMSLYSHCVLSSWSLSSSVVTVLTLMPMLPLHCPGHDWALVPAWLPGQVGSSVSAHYISHRPRVPVSASLHVRHPGLMSAATHVFLRYNLSPACPPICVPISQPLSEMSQPGETEMTPPDTGCDTWHLRHKDWGQVGKIQSRVAQ